MQFAIIIIISKGKIKKILFRVDNILWCRVKTYDIKYFQYFHYFHTK